MMVFLTLQMFGHLYAARSALALPVRQCHMVYVWPAWTRSWAPWEPVKREGKIKGPARAGPQSQSARGLVTARRPAAGVPSQNANPQGTGLGRVPFSMRYASLRWRVCHGLA